MFWGPVSTGKSYIAGCIANNFLKREVTVKMTNFNTIIDDLVAERNSEYVFGIIFSVIDCRIRSGRPLIITTNLPLKEIKSEIMLDKRVSMNVFGKCVHPCMWEARASEK